MFLERTLRLRKAMSRVRISIILSRFVSRDPSSHGMSWQMLHGNLMERTAACIEFLAEHVSTYAEHHGTIEF